MSFLRPFLVEKLPSLASFFFLLAVFFLPISKAMVEIGAMTTIVAWLTLKVLRKEDFFADKWLLYPYSLLLAWMVFSFVNIEPENLYKGVRGFLKWIEYFGFLAITAEILSKEKMRRWCLLIFFSSMLLVSINGFYQLWNGTDFLRNVSLDPGRITRMKSSLGAANNLASFFLMAMPLAFYALYTAFKDKKTKQALCYLLLLGVFMTAFIWTFSRAAFLGIVISTLIYTSFRNWKASLFFLAALFISLGFSETLRENFITSLNFNDITIRERLIQWEASLELIKAHPVIGHGINMFYQVIPTLELESGPYRGYAHNSFLQLTVELGFVGFILLLIPMIYGIGKIFLVQKSGLNDALWVGLSAYLIQALFDNNLFAMQSAFLFWTFWGFYFRSNSLSVSIPSHTI